MLARFASKQFDRFQLESITFTSKNLSTCIENFTTYIQRNLDIGRSTECCRRRSMEHRRILIQSHERSVHQMDAIQQSWTSFKGTVRGFDTPHQLGLGLAFGIAVGLIPKDSLLPYAIGVIAILSTANLLCFGIGVVVAHVVSPALDHLTHVIGSWFLTFSPLEPIWATLSEFPLVAWTRFNNSVVMGTLILGILLAVPIYTMTRMVSRSIRHRFVSRRERHTTDSPSTVTTQV